jgi:hypothetical protein
MNVKTISIGLSVGRGQNNNIPIGHEYDCTGDTWGYRDLIKKHGGYWCKWNRRWYLSKEGRDAVLAELDKTREEEELHANRSK